jgi:ABC-2 type transport system permease protein
MMFLSGTFFPVEMMPWFLQKFASVLPLYYVNQGLRSTMIFGDNITALKYAGITAGVAIVLFAVGAKVTRWDRDA